MFALRRTINTVVPRTRWAFTRSIVQEIPVPSLGDSISDGTLVEFVKEIGEGVIVDEIIGTIETDKVSIDIRSPVAGTVTELLVQPDDTVVVGQVLMNVDPDVAATVESASATAPPTTAAPTTPPPSTTPAPPTPAAPVATPPLNAPATHDRQPLIRFRDGHRATIDADRFQPASGGPSPVIVGGDSDFLSLPVQFQRRLQMSEEEMEMINLGGASDDYDVDVTLRYI